MPVDAADYYEGERALRWFDIDPRFDRNWSAWAKVRPYAYVPDLGTLVSSLGALPFERLRHYGTELNDICSAVAEYNGPIKQHEYLTIDQIKFAVGDDRTIAGTLRVVRIDKALSTIYAINRELDRQAKPQIKPTIVLSAFNIRGLSKAFSDLTKEAKETLKIELAAHLSQPNQLASDFLKGNKASFDVAAQAHAFVLNRQGFATIPRTLAAALETPSIRNAPSSESEDFSRGRLEAMPEGYRRPE